MKITFTDEDFASEEATEKSAMIFAVMAGEAALINTESKPYTTDDDNEDEETAAEKKKRIAKEKRDAKKAKEKAEAEDDEDEDEDETENEKDESSVTRDQVRAALKDYAAIEGKPAAIKILHDHGAKTMSELADNKFADVIEACDV